MKKIILLLAIAFSSATLLAQTWSGEIAAIVYNNCSKCHNSNGIAPMELMSYQDAVDNADDMRDEVQSRKMPPWPPNPQYSRLAHERILTQQQIDDISNWVYIGTPRGDSLTEPAAPVFTSATDITNPDLIISCPVYPVNTTSDLYRCFVVPSTMVQDAFITALEAIPGDRSIVHHILIYSDTSNIPVILDALDPDPGYTFFGGTGSPNSKLIGAWVPGQKTYYSPQGMGIRLPANSNVVLQIHYPGGISNETDSSKLFINLSSTPQREITIDSPLNHYGLDNGPLFIPANTISTFYDHLLIPSDVSVLSVGPHMHLVGKSIKSWGVTSSNDTIPFIDIPEWDFHWQGSYSFPKVLKIPAGTTIYSEATYDNTTANEENPNDPPADVQLGESTTDEMMLIYFAYLPYQSGDENIIIDSTFVSGIENPTGTIVSTPQLYDPSPNPSSGKITVQYYLPKKTESNMTVCDIKGSVIRKVELNNAAVGMISTSLDLSDLNAGVYFLNLVADGVTRTKKIIIR